jgi:MFS transporter, DHA1 family, staphyloferrin B biosynthesis exporter
MPSTVPQAARLVQYLFWIQLVSMGAMEMSGPFWPLHLRSLATSEFEFGVASVMVYIAPMLGIVLTGAFWGRIGDRVGHKLMMIRALLGLALTQLALAYASDAAAIVVLRFVQGAFAGYIAPAQAYGVGIESSARRSRLFALLQIATNVGSLAGAVLGGVVLDHASFFWINAGAAVLCAVCAAAVAWLLPNLPPAGTHAASPAGGSNATATSAAGPMSPVGGLLIALGLLLLSRMLPQAPFALYVSSVFQARHWIVGLCYGLLALGFVLSASLWARYFEHRSVRDALGRLAAVALGCAALASLAGATRALPVFALTYLLWGVLLGATTPVLTSLISRSSDARRQGHVLGLVQGTSQFAAVSGIALGGVLSQAAGLEFIYFFVALFYGFAAAAIFQLRRRHPAALASAAPTAAIHPHQES